MKECRPWEASWLCLSTSWAVFSQINFLWASSAWNVCKCHVRDKRQYNINLSGVVHNVESNALGNSYLVGVHFAVLSLPHVPCAIQAEGTGEVAKSLQGKDRDAPKVEHPWSSAGDWLASLSSGPLQLKQINWDPLWNAYNDIEERKRKKRQNVSIWHGQLILYCSVGGHFPVCIHSINVTSVSPLNSQIKLLKLIGIHF